MSIFPYIYYMVQSFHITDDDKQISFYAGLVTSAFALAEAMSSGIWGRLSDKLGRKPILLVGLAGTSLSMLVFGFAQNLQTALIARALGGLLNGNIGVLQTTVAEVVKSEEHQAIALSIMPTIWCVGAIVGSILGGSFADPVHNHPEMFKAGSFTERFLTRFPYLPPNLVCTTVLLVGIVVGIFFLEETHEDLKHHRDMGLELAKWIEDIFRKTPYPPIPTRKAEYPGENYALLHSDEQLPDYKSTASSPELGATAAGLPPPYEDLETCQTDSVNGTRFALALDSAHIESASPKAAAIKDSSGVWRALNTQLVLNIVGYGILA
jgi:MFS family permease